MIDPGTLHRIGYVLLFVGLAGLIIFIRLLPLDANGGSMPPPDLILALGFAWVLRRPDYLPVLLFAAIMLVTDMLFLRPPGVWAGMAVIGLEFLRARAGLMREQPFAAEWATVVAVMVAMMLAERIVLAVFFVEQVSFGLSVLGLLANILAYPVVVGVSIWGLRVRRLAPGEHAAEVRLT